MEKDVENIKKIDILENLCIHNIYILETLRQQFNQKYQHTANMLNMLKMLKVSQAN